MATIKSRYAMNATIFNQDIGEPIHYATWNIPSALRGYTPFDLLGTTSAFQYVWQFGDRIDRLSAKFLGDDRYWWIIAIINQINYPLGIKVGTIILIPSSVQPILEKLGMV